MRRAFAVAAATLIGIAGLAGPSAAAVLPQCGDVTGSGDIPGETCEVTVVAECEPDGDVVLEYAVENAAPGVTTVDITWTGLPTGDVLVASQPLSGTLPWPADVTRAVTLEFGTTPPTTVTAEFPEECREDAVLARNPVTPARTPAAPVRQSGLSGVLAATGLEAESLAIGAGALIAGGAALVLVRRARRDGV